MVSFGIFLSFLTGFVTVNLISLKFSLIEKLGLSFPIGIALQTLLMLLMDAVGIAHPIAFVPDDFPSERTCSGDSETGLFRFLRF